MSTCPQCLDQINAGTDCPQTPVRLNYFTEIVIDGTLVIPPQKPPKEKITNVTKNFSVEDIEVIDVNLGNVQGKKVVIAGTLTLGIEYSADVPTQEVHYAHFNIPFQAMIKYRPCTPENRGLITDPNFNISNYNIRICVEHEQYHQLSPREIEKILVVLIWLEPKTDVCPPII